MTIGPDVSIEQNLIWDVMHGLTVGPNVSIEQSVTIKHWHDDVRNKSFELISRKRTASLTLLL